MKQKKNKQNLTRFLLFCLVFFGIFKVNAQTPIISLQQGLPISSTAPLKGIAYGNGKFVTANNYSLTTGLMYSSSDGDNWSRIIDAGIPSTAILQSGVYANSVFVFVGDGGIILTSSNGQNWTSRTSGTTNNLSNVIYAASKFYAVGASNTVLSSTDGITWTAISTGTSGYLFMNIAYGNNSFAIAAYDASNNPRVLYSSTGASNSWSIATLSGNGVNGVNFLKDKFYAFDTGGRTFTSTSGSSWTEISNYTVNLPGGGTTSIRGDQVNTFNQMFNGIYDGTKIYLFGSSTYAGGYGAVFSSTDGTIWTHQARTTNLVCQNSAYLNNKYFQLGNEGLVSSTDGIIYKYPDASHNSVVKNGTDFITVGNTGSSEGAIFKSGNWTSWTNNSVSGPNVLNSVIYGNSKYVAVGNAGSVVSSSDGVTWTSGTSGDSDILRSVAYGNGKFVAVGIQGKIIYSTDGVTWTQANKDGASGSNFYGVKYLNGKFIAVGGSVAVTTGTTRLAYSTDGVSWTTNSPSIVGHFHDIAYDGTRYLIVGRTNNSTLADREFFSITSTEITSSTFSSPVYLAASATNNIKIGGLGVGGVAYSNGKFVALGNQNATPGNAYVLYSSDNGATWSASAVGTTGRLRGIVPDGDNFRIVGTASVKVLASFASSSSITAAGTLSAFSSCSGTVSSSQSFTVLGSGLTGDIIVTAPSGFEVSTSSAIGFASSVTLTQSGGSVASTTIYVRLSSSASGNPAGNITCTSTGASTQNVAASGSVITTPAPTASEQTFCSGATVADLAATGTSLKWYAANSGGSDLATSTALSSGTYYVSQTLNDCESTRTSVSVTVTPSTSNTTTQTACTSYTWSVNGTTYTTSGTYTSVTGCATEILDLTITTQPIVFTSGSINYFVTSPNTVSVGFNGDATGDVVIPESVTTTCGSYAVTGINQGAFYNCSGLTSVTIPNSVISIGANSFAYCSSLTSVTLPDTLTSINSGVFSNCSQLSSISIPNSVTSIGDTAFYNCTNLTSVSIPNSVTSMGEFVFQFCSSLSSVSISNSLTSIGKFTFFGCTSLTSVIIPNSVTSIGDNTFQNCSNLNSVTLSNTLTSIGNITFLNCSNLTSITIPNSVTSIGYAAFNGCTGLTSVICNVTSPITINGSVFGGVNQAACSLTVPNGSVAAYQAAAIWQNFAPIFSYSKVIDSQCGTTLSALNTLIKANAIPGASHYKFKVVNGTTTEIFEPTNGRKWFRLTSLPGGTFYNTAYTISVAAKKNNVWGDYGTECTVTTPAFPTTKVKDSQCGVTLASITTFISADAVNAASGYRFKVVNGASTEIIEAVSGSRWFRLTSIPGGAFYNTTYTISAASRYNGVWSDYGSECTVTTPSAPLSKIIDRQCGMTLASGNATLLYATSVSVAQKYRFEVRLGADTYLYDTASSSVRSFRMTEVPGLTLVSGTTYSIRVAIMVNDAWQPYGESCNITTFGDAPNFVKSMNVDTTNFNVTTYPNPFTENFNLNLTSLSEEKVTVMVYDMTGKLFERKEVVPSELSALQVGANFASGVYNVIVSQGAHTKSIRVIKK